MNLVVGATGYLGIEACRQLALQGAPLRAMARATSDVAKVATLREYGATLVCGDLKDKDSLDAACSGVRTVITTASTTLSAQPGDTIDTVDRDGQIRLVDSAVASGVERFIYVSYSRNIDVDCPLVRAKRAVERRLQESGLSYTILRPSYFMEIWLSPALGFDYAERKARIYGDGGNPISFVSLIDVARFAVESLSNPAFVNAVAEIGGPEALAPLDVVRIFEEIGASPFAIDRLPAHAIKARYDTATDPLDISFAALMFAYARGDRIPMDVILRRAPMTLTSVRDYAIRVMRS